MECAGSGAGGSDRALRLGSIGADLHSTYAFVPFPYRRALRRSRPILGLTVRLQADVESQATWGEMPAFLQLLARDETGYRNLRLTSRAEMERAGAAPCGGLQDLERFSAGVASMASAGSSRAGRGRPKRRRRARRGAPARDLRRRWFCIKSSARAAAHGRRAFHRAPGASPQRAARGHHRGALPRTVGCRSASGARLHPARHDGADDASRSCQAHAAQRSGCGSCIAIFEALANTGMAGAAGRARPAPSGRSIAARARAQSG